jgi:diadenosine tetraphosphate (Ap4A) HIT family hydrolase
MSNLRIQNSRVAEQTERMKIAEQKNICPFCPDGLKEIHKLPIIKKTANFFITKNAFPYEGTDYHYLIISKKHHTDISKIKSKEWGEIGSLCSYITKKEKISGGGVFLRFGDLGKNGSTIKHIHFHVISGNSDDSAPEHKREPLRVKLGFKKK